MTTDCLNDTQETVKRLVGKRRLDKKFESHYAEFRLGLSANNDNTAQCMDLASAIRAAQCPLYRLTNALRAITRGCSAVAKMASALCWFNAILLPHPKPIISTRLNPPDNPVENSK